MLRNGVRIFLAHAKNASGLISQMSANHLQATRSFADAAKEIKLPTTVYGISGKYASALYVSAAKAKTLEPVESELQKIIEAAEKNPTFGEFLKDPTVPKLAKTNAIQELLDAAKFTPITKNFLSLLADAGRLSDLSKIAASYTELLRAYRKEVLAAVTTAQLLSSSEIAEVEEAIKLNLPKGSTLKLELKVNPKIIGGLVIDIGDKHFDMSIDTKIKQMEKVLAEAL